MSGKLIFSSIVALVIFNSCADDNSNSLSPAWNKLGLDGKIVNELALNGDLLFAATNDGLYSKNIDNADEDFELRGFEGQNVQSMIFTESGTILVSLADRSGAHPPALYFSFNGGENWQEKGNNFGGDFPELIFDLAIQPGSENVLYGAGPQVVAKSTDFGSTWTPIWGEWGGFGTGMAIVTVNPEKTSEIWAGGQGGIENGFLLRSNDEINWDSWHTLVENPTVVKEIVFDPRYDNRLYVGWEGALQKTVDGGTSWQTVIQSDESRFYFGIALNEANPDIVYTGGWIKKFDQPQPFFLQRSENGGSTWKKYQFSGEDFGGVYDMKIRTETNRDRVFVGLYKGGVYEVIFPNTSN